MEDEILRDNLILYWQNIIDALVTSLQDVGRYASGVTAQSIAGLNTTPVTFRFSTQVRVTLWMPDYYAYIDEGVSGARENTNISRFKYGSKLPPISGIRQFMLNRGIVADDYRDIGRTRKGKDRNTAVNKSLNRLAYVIAFSIWKRGLKPTNFYTNVVNDQSILKFEQQLLTEYGRLIVNIVDTAFE